jgi:hypothetical protein
MSGYRTAPDGKWIVVAAAAGGSEQDDLHLLDTSTNQLAPLFVDSETVFGSVLWKRDSSGFAYRANKENKSDFNVYIHDLATGKSRRVMDRAGYYYPVDFNATGDKLVVGKYNSASHSQLFEIDLHDLATREITPADEAWSFDGAGYTPDEKHFLAVTNYRGDLSNLRTIDLASGAIAPFAPELDRYEIDGAGFNHERDVLAILANEDGYRTLHLRAMPENQPLPTPKMGKGLVGNVNFCKSDMLFSLTNANTPGIIYRWSRKTPDQAPVALTEADTQGIDVSKFYPAQADQVQVVRRAGSARVLIHPARAHPGHADPVHRVVSRRAGRAISPGVFPIVSVFSHPGVRRARAQRARQQRLRQEIPGNGQLQVAHGQRDGRGVGGPLVGQE